MRSSRATLYWFIAPALVVVVGIIAFPWAFTLWMSLFDWKIGSARSFIGLANFTTLAGDTRFLQSIGHTLWFTLLAVIGPLFFGTLAALVFNEKFLLRGLARGIFTLPMILPFIMIAAVVRLIDALKTFDTIYVITQGGPGTASETINLYLYLQAFSFYQVGKASAVVVVFFVIVVALSLTLFWMRERSKWTE